MIADGRRAEAYRELAQAIDDVAMYRNLLALIPWTVHVDHDVERARLAARRLGSIPRPRGPVDIPPTRRPGAPLRRPR